MALKGLKRRDGAEGVNTINLKTSEGKNIRSKLVWDGSQTMPISMTVITGN